MFQAAGGKVISFFKAGGPFSFVHLFLGGRTIKAEMGYKKYTRKKQNL